MSLAARAIVAIFRVYKLAISPLIGPACRFEPTCSVYGTDAVSRYGARRGLSLTIRRILRCRPGVPGGYDPVP